MTMVRTRFAPSPTGYLHLGGARTALFSWAFARRHKGTFILRVEDTDLERSTPENTQVILDAMAWLGLDYDEGPFYQMQRMDRYREVLKQLIEEGKAYYCYASKEELEAMREEQIARGEKPRYDRRWRDSRATPPAGVSPVVRFKNPLDGAVVIDDLVKGRIVVNNCELDDLIIARSDGTPTYNFCVVVDDWDMQITHVIRGDDHINNTPRQINILKALGAPLPQYAHLSMILGADGEKLSKRHASVSVLDYEKAGFLPEAMLNYLARLGWARGDEELFTMAQFVEWFDLAGVSKSAARFDAEKLAWVSAHHLKQADASRLAELSRPFMLRDGCDCSHGPDFAQVVELLRERVKTVEELADAAVYFYRPLDPETQVLEQHVTTDILPVMAELSDRFETIEWTREAIHEVMKSTVAAHGLKFPKVAMPLRVLVTGEPQTPAVDAVLALIGKQEVVARLRHQLAKLASGFIPE
ncbi:glutamate--tRNA ligase [Sulfurimicrobium lacus]|uniref:Glutamate--tRNA ligase n=2 Tax=Sulfurimicrobium lacus TaxID=2715678 RepID=A0A6F8VBJ2_9PROT|nr:glutamate--tRNA ligase [Sulfurimicrobium lacus]